MSQKLETIWKGVRRNTDFFISIIFMMRDIIMLSKIKYKGCGMYGYFKKSNGKGYI